MIRFEQESLAPTYDPSTMSEVQSDFVNIEDSVSQVADKYLQPNCETILLNTIYTNSIMPKALWDVNSKVS